LSFPPPEDGRHRADQPSAEKYKHPEDTYEPPPPKTTFTGKDGAIWKPACVNHIGMLIGDALPTKRDPLKVVRVISTRSADKGVKYSKYRKPVECFVCSKFCRFWFTEHNTA